MLDVKIKGFKELMKALDELPVKLERNIVRGALRAAAKVTEAEAKSRAPAKSGKLRESIRVTTRLIKGRPVAYVRVGGRSKKRSERAPHAHLVEFGTKAHYIKPKSAKSLFVAGLLREGVEHPGATKQPFMRPAFDATAQTATVAFGQYVKARLTKEGIETPELALDDEG